MDRGNIVTDKPCASVSVSIVASSEMTSEVSKKLESNGRRVLRSLYFENQSLVIRSNHNSSILTTLSLTPKSSSFLVAEVLSFFDSSAFLTSAVSLLNFACNLFSIICRFFAASEASLCFSSILALFRVPRTSPNMDFPPRLEGPEERLRRGRVTAGGTSVVVEGGAASSGEAVIVGLEKNIRNVSSLITRTRTYSSDIAQVKDERREGRARGRHDARARDSYVSALLGSWNQTPPLPYFSWSVFLSTYRKCHQTFFTSLDQQRLNSPSDPPWSAQLTKTRNFAVLPRKGAYDNHQ